MSNLSISGAVSGLDTASIISQLIAVEGRQQQMISDRKDTAQHAVDAYASMITSFKGLATQAKALADTSSWLGTGAASQFSLSGLSGFSGMNVLSTGADAKIFVGDPGTGYEVTSSTNTFAGVVQGLSFSVSKLEDGVTVASTVDGSSVADSVSKL